MSVFGRVKIYYKSNNQNNNNNTKNLFSDEMKEMNEGKKNYFTYNNHALLHIFLYKNLQKTNILIFSETKFSLMIIISTQQIYKL